MPVKARVAKRVSARHISMSDERADWVYKMRKEGHDNEILARREREAG